MNIKKLLFVILIILVITINLIIFLKPNFTGGFIMGPESFDGSNTDNSDFQETVFVTRVIDGDTVIANGESIRLLGIDTDEKGERCYKEAKTKLEELVLNKDVKLENDDRNKDKYNRYLRWIFLVDEENKTNNFNINLKMVQDGLAIARFYEEKKYKKEILDAEKRARDKKIGCKWSTAN